MAKEAIIIQNPTSSAVVNTARGLVRPIIAVGVVGTMCYLAIKGDLEAKDFLTLGTVVVTFYFAEKAVMKGIEKVNGTGSG